LWTEKKYKEVEERKVRAIVDPKLGFKPSFFPSTTTTILLTRILTRFGPFVSLNIGCISSNPTIIASVLIEKCVRKLSCVGRSSFFLMKNYRNAGFISRTMWEDR
jgi:hypothetical protein